MTEKSDLITALKRLIETHSETTAGVFWHSAAKMNTASLAFPLAK